MTIRIAIIFTTIIISFNSFDAYSQLLILDLNNKISPRYGIQKTFDKKDIGNKNALSYPDVEGSPYLKEAWGSALVQLKNGSEYLVSKVNMNLYTGELEFIDNVDVKMTVEPDKIEKVFFLKENDSTSFSSAFVTLYNHIEKKPFAFFQILNSGIYQLLLFQKSVVMKSPPDPFVEKKPSYFSTKRYYVIYNNGKITPLKSLDQDHIFSALKVDNEDLSWLNKNKNKLKTTVDVISFLDFHNSIHIQK
jgi:hypothetical protein